MSEPNPSAEREQVKPTPRRWRRWRWVALALVVMLALCIGVPVGYVVWPLVVGTVNADHGEGSPGAAVLAFVFTVDDGVSALSVALAGRGCCDSDMSRHSSPPRSHHRSASASASRSLPQTRHSIRLIGYA